MPCSNDVSPLCLVTTGWDRKQEFQRSRLEGANSWRLHRQQDWIRTAICQNIWLKLWKKYIVRILGLLCICSVTFVTIVQNKPFFTYGQNVAPSDSIVRTYYIQQRLIVSLIPFLQGGLENVPWSWRTFPLTHSHWHLWLNYLINSSLSCDPALLISLS